MSVSNRGIYQWGIMLWELWLYNTMNFIEHEPNHGAFTNWHSPHSAHLLHSPRGCFQIDYFLTRKFLCSKWRTLIGLIKNFSFGLSPFVIIVILDPANSSHCISSGLCLLREIDVYLIKTKFLVFLISVSIRYWASEKGPQGAQRAHTHRTTDDITRYIDLTWKRNFCN